LSIVPGFSLRTEGIDQVCEGRVGLTVQIVEAIADHERRPVGEHVDQAAGGHVLLHNVLRQIRQPKASQGGLEDQWHRIERERTFDPDPQLVPVLGKGPNANCVGTARVRSGSNSALNAIV
jgi:hypothetical protein